MKKNFFYYLAVFSLSMFAWSEPCTSPDIGGTALFPPMCPYDSYQHPMLIQDGLPPGTEMTLTGPLEVTDVFSRTPGGDLGGEEILCTAQFSWKVEGSGELDGYTRMITMPLNCVIHIGPLNPGDPIQQFQAQISQLDGQIVGDPDFDLLRVGAGDDYGLPSPGNTILAELPNGNFNVDSFFDITYQIEFQGAPGSILEGYTGTTTGFVPREIPVGFSTFFILDEMPDWDNALNPRFGDSQILPLEESEWTDYLAQINDPLNMEDPAEPYPSTIFMPAKLYVAPCNGGGGAGGCVDGESTDGLVMRWGDETLPDREYASAWKYVYGDDPDLSNSILKISVEAPCGMQQISVGLQDINGNIRGWYWNVAASGAPGGPGLLRCSPDLSGNPVRNQIVIDLSQVGTAAATPAAFNFSNTPGFDITQVIQVIFDENMSWVAGTVPPPPGQVDPQPWNYWFDLSITPNAKANKGYYVKYSQPPVEIEDGMIVGWDEISMYRNQMPPTSQWPIMADDWKCIDKRPVTDVHWWGSFKGWSGNSLPTVIPMAFHIGIWTDIPASGNQPSQPDMLVWQHVCDNWVWNYAGVDVDPRCEDPDFPCELNESCFQFNQLLSEPDWFWQDPLEGERVYWLSIAAIYPDGAQVTYPWGWKTREHFYNDDAVRITDTGGQWPPTVNQLTVTGIEEVQFPLGVSWDLAFELTTNEQLPCYALPSDLNHDCVVDLDDLAIMASEWLMTE